MHLKPQKQCKREFFASKIVFQSRDNVSMHDFQIVVFRLNQLVIWNSDQNISSIFEFFLFREQLAEIFPFLNELNR